MSADVKMDMSLDQIIKLQRKEKQTSGTKVRGVRGGRGGAVVGRGGRGAAGIAGLAKSGKTNVVGGAAAKGKGRKLGFRVNSLARRALARNGVGAAAKAGRGRTTAVQRRVSQNILKRAIIQNRRSAFAQRRNVSNQNRGGGAGVAAAKGTKTGRLLADVQHWRNTARQLQRALNVQKQQQQQPRPQQQRTFSNARRGRVSTAPVVVSNVKQRLGWRNAGARTGTTAQVGRGITRGRGRGRGFSRASQNVRGRGTTLGQMQSDLVVQDRQVAIRIQQSGDYARNRRQQQIGQFRNLNTRAFNNTSAQREFTRGRGRRGRGNQMATRSLARNTTDVGSSFNQGTGTGRKSLHERFGGNSTPVVRVNTANNNNNSGNRRSRQIFF